MLFQPELGWIVLELLGRPVISGRWAPLQKQETKKIGGGSPVASLMPKSVFLVEEKINCLRNEVLGVCLRTFHRWGGLVFIVGDFPNWMLIQTLCYWMGDFLSLSLSN